jgi:hypothetical protein
MNIPSDANQREAFMQYEANQWFAPNKSILLSYNGEEDHVASLMKQYQLKPERILESGSSAGHRLTYLRGLHPSAQMKDLDPSTNAVNFGKKMYPQIDLHY